MTKSIVTSLSKFTVESAIRLPGRLLQLPPLRCRVRLHDSRCGASKQLAGWRDGCVLQVVLDALRRASCCVPTGQAHDSIRGGILVLAGAAGGAGCWVLCVLGAECAWC